MDNASPYRCEVIAGEQGFRGLRDEWIALLAEAKIDSVFASFEWLFEWWRHVGASELLGKKQLHLVAIRSSGRLTGLAPFTIRTANRLGVRVQRVQWLGLGFSDFNDFLFASDFEQQLRTVVSFLAANRDRWDAIDLWGVPATSETVALLPHIAADSGLKCVVRPDAVAPYLALTDEPARLIGGRSRKLHDMVRNVRSSMRKFDKDGLRLRVVESPHREAGLLDRMIKLERAKQIGGKATAPVLGKADGFFRTVFDQLGAQQRIRVAVLEKNDELIAYNLNFVSGNSLWYYNTAYHARYRSYSPGKLVLLASMDFAYQHGFAEYNFLGGDEAYKLRFTDTVRETKRILVTHGDLKSRAVGRWMSWKTAPKGPRASGQPRTSPQPQRRNK